MLYVCSVPLDADAENPKEQHIKIVDILPNLNTRKRTDYCLWESYRHIFNYQRIWIVEPGEMQYRTITDINFHRGETL